MSIDRQSKYVIALWGILEGITVFSSAYTSDYMPYKVAWAKYLKFYSSDSFLASVIGMLISIYALALPLTINIVSDKLAPYGDKEITEWFKNKWEVYYQRVFIPFLIGYIIILLFANIKNGFGCLVVLGFSLYSLIMTYRYFRTIINISSDTANEIITWSSEIAKSKLK
jgi:hypothetical protein